MTDGSNEASMSFEERKRRAHKLVKEDNYVGAFAEFCQLYLANPKDVEIIKICSFLLDRIIEGNYDFEPQTAEQFIFRGISKFYKKEYEASINDFDKALSINSKLDYALKCRAFSLTSLKKYSLAIKELEKAIQIKPTGEYFDDLAENYSRIGDIKSALIYHEKAVANSPDEARLWHNYATQLGECGQIEKAISMFDRAIELFPLYEDALHDRQYYSNLLTKNKNDR